MKFNQPPLWDMFHPVIYLFILTIGFFSLPLATNFSLRESKVVNLESWSCQVLWKSTWPSNSSASTFIRLYGSIQINWFGQQSAGLLSFSSQFLMIFIEQCCWKLLNCYNTSCCDLKKGHYICQIGYQTSLIVILLLIKGLVHLLICVCHSRYFKG